MHKLDAPATRAWVSERILSVTRVPAYPTNVLFLLLVIVVLSRCRRVPFVLLFLQTTRRRRRGAARRRNRRTRRVYRALGGCGGVVCAIVVGRRRFMSDLHGRRYYKGWRVEPNQPATGGDLAGQGPSPGNTDLSSTRRERGWREKEKERR